MPTPKPKVPKNAASAAGRLIPPKDGAVVRMYRIGHGDCFLLAFDGKTAGRPVYVLIDCGYKPGSPDKIVRPARKNVRDITASIRAATGGEIDVAIITHEHQDHVNGITEENFAGITIKETWLAWTENPDDDVANALRERFEDKLLGLMAARNRLAAGSQAKKLQGVEAEADDKAVEDIDEFLAFELGGVETSFNATAATAMLGADGKPKVSSNKQSMLVFKKRASEGVKYLRPHEKIHALPGAKNARVFALGPPRSEEQILDVNPVGKEEFHALGTASAATFFASAFTEPKAGEGKPQLFHESYGVPLETAFTDPDFGEFFRKYYGSKDAAAVAKPDARPPAKEVPGDAPWRRIDDEWLFSALQLAIEVNNATNNTSLVLAFELGKEGKVLLFAADAQRGNWISWTKGSWKDGDKQITAKDLLGRTVLYKVGHHGSHNATLNGKISDSYANLNWMGQGDQAREFTAMITAVRAWAETQKGWDHPLKAIKDALLKKCSGRVFQTDTDFDQMQKTVGESQANWDKFKSRVTGDTLYFDYQINA